MSSDDEVTEGDDVDGHERDGRQPDTDSGAGPVTVEQEVRRQLATHVGGARGALELALPIAVFTLVFVIVDEVRTAAIAGVGVGVALYAVRVATRSTTLFVRNGLVAIGFAAVFAMATGRAESAFLPGILQSGAWALGLTVSLLVRWPAAGFLIGAILGDATGWRERPEIVRLANRLTLVLLVPMALRVAVQYPLYLAGEVGWLGVSRIALGWPLSLAAFAVAAAILARGRTPLHAADPSRSPGGTGDRRSW